MLKIKNLTAIIGEEGILNKIDLEVNKGEIHALMGPKGAGKTVLANAILGNPTLSIKEGTISYNKKSINDKTMEERSLLGIFTFFQYLPIINNVDNLKIISTALRARKDKRSSTEIEKEYKRWCEELEIPQSYSSSISAMSETIKMIESKKNEVIQILMLNPTLLVLDEIDTDVGEKELELLAAHIKFFLSDKTKSAIVITHNHKLLDILEPTHVHIMAEGAIVERGPKELYKRIIEDGYPQLP